MKTEMILCSSLDAKPVVKPGAPAVPPAGPPLIKPESSDDPGCCDIPVKSGTIGDDPGSKANETGGLPGDSGKN